LTNLTPDDKGQVQITAKDLAGAQHIRIVVVDLFSVSQKSIFRELNEVEAVDQRLAESLDSEKHFVQQRQIDVLDAGESLVIEDFVNANFQYYNELSDVFRLYQNLGNDADSLRKFAFVMQWLEKSPEEKRSLYSEFACHELNFFIYKKDRPFFDEVVAPHLEHKREPTFIDQWLLEEDLADWFEPWNFSRLNTFEKILLSQRLTKNRADIARHVLELYELNPTTRQQFGSFYDMAKQFDDSNEELQKLAASKGLRFEEARKKSLPKFKRGRGRKGQMQGQNRYGEADDKMLEEEAIQLGVPLRGAAPPAPNAQVIDQNGDGAGQSWAIRACHENGRRQTCHRNANTELHRAGSLHRKHCCS